MLCNNPYCEKESLSNGKYCKACTHIKRVGYQSGYYGKDKDIPITDILLLIRKLIKEEKNDR